MARAASVHRPLGDAFVIEVSDLLAEVEALQQRRAPRSGLEGVIGIGQPQALRGGEVIAGLIAVTLWTHGYSSAGESWGRAAFTPERGRNATFCNPKAGIGIASVAGHTGAVIGDLER
jgi:hypothetical protein